MYARTITTAGLLYIWYIYLGRHDDISCPVSIFSDLFEGEGVRLFGGSQKHRYLPVQGAVRRPSGFRSRHRSICNSSAMMCRCLCCWSSKQQMSHFCSVCHVCRVSVLVWEARVSWHLPLRSTGPPFITPHGGSGSGLLCVLGDNHAPGCCSAVSTKQCVIETNHVISDRCNYSIRLPKSKLSTHSYYSCCRCCCCVMVPPVCQSSFWRTHIPRVSHEGSC